MVPYLDGLRAEWKKSGNWPAYLNLAPGRHQFELRFESIFATAFVVAVYAYLMTLLICGYLRLHQSIADFLSGG